MQIEKQRQGYKLIQIQSGRYEEIPNDWNVVTLKNLITDIKSGFASGARDENGVIQLRMNNITDNGTLDFSKILKVPIPDDIEQYYLKKDDVLFNNTNSLDLIGKTTIVDNLIDHTFSNHITRIRTDKTKLVPYFLMLLFLKYKVQAIFRSICNTHVGQSGIGKNELLRLKIICPPLIEQQKIASILSNIDSLINQTQKIIGQTQRLKKGLLQRLLTKGIGHIEFKKIKSYFGKVEEIPRSWNYESIQNLTTHVTYGLTVRPKYVDEGVPLISTREIENEEIQFEKALLISQQDYDSLYEKCKGKKNDVFYSKTGTIGLVTRAKIDRAFAITQNIASLRPNEKRIMPEFLEISLRTNSFFNKCFRTLNATTITDLQLGELKKIKIPLPDLKEQNKIVSIVTSVDSNLNLLKSKKSKLGNLKKGLMQKLLTGQIRVKV